MHHASNLGHENVVKVMVNHARFRDVVNMKANDGKTPLHYAAWKGHTEVVSLLLRNGASVSIIEDVSYGVYFSSICCELFLSECLEKVYGYIPLHYACAKNTHLKIIEMLIGRGSDVNAADFVSSSWKCCIYALTRNILTDWRYFIA